MNEHTLKLNPENGHYEGAYTITFQVEAEIVRRALWRYAEENNVDPANIDAWQKAVEAVTSSGKWIDHPRSKWMDYPYAKPATLQSSEPSLKQEMPVVTMPETVQGDEIIAILKRTGKSMGAGEIRAQMAQTDLGYDAFLKRLARKVDLGILCRPEHGKYALVQERAASNQHHKASHEQLSPEDEQVLREQALHLPVDAWDDLLTPIPVGGTHRDKQPIYRRRYAEKQALARLKAELEPARIETLHAIADAVNGARTR